jgi:hypothetical protein
MKLLQKILTKLKATTSSVAKTLLYAASGVNAGGALALMLSLM